MSFIFQRQGRIAGSVMIFIGLYLHNWSVVLFGNVIVAASYMWAISKIEVYIEEQNKSKEENEDAIR